MQYFFGYAENYTIMTAVLCLFLYLGWRCALGQKSIWFVLLAFVISGLFHLSAWFLLPGMIYLLWNRGREENKSAYKALAFVIACLAAVAATYYYANYKGEQVFVPLIGDELNPYSLFSTQHMSDVANLLLLTAPLPIFIFACTLAGKIKKSALLSPQSLFLTYCLGGALLFTVYVDPKLGAMRDWDLLSLYGIPAAFLAALLYSEVFKQRRQAVTLLLVGLAVILIHTAPWIASNTDAYNSLAYIKSVVRSDVHYTPDYYRGERLMSWGGILADYFGDLEEKRRCYGLRVRGAPDDQRAWLIYATANYELGENRLCAQALTHIYDISRFDDYQIENLARLQLQLGDVENGRRTLQYFSEHYPESFDYLFLSGLLHQLERDHSSAALYYERAIALNPNDVDLLLNYATMRMNDFDFTLATTLLIRAENIPNLSERDRADIAHIRRTLKSFMKEVEDSTKTP
jgi:tetratricopeptide (TPR) repeat protein